MAQWVDQEGLSLDVCSAGELAVASSVNFPAERIIVHGNAKTPRDLQAAFRYGAGRIAVDSTSEIVRLAALAPARQRVLIRVTPGVDAHVHRAVTTGTDDQKFGFSLSSGAAAEAVQRVVSHPRLELAGLHCHLGSQITELSGYEVAARKLIGLMAAVPGPSWASASRAQSRRRTCAVPYVPGDTGFDLADFADRVRQVVTTECARFRLPVPRLTVEPGRAIVNRAMIALYRVVTVKHAIGVRTFVAVDGGMSDNPRPELYGAKYPVYLVRRRARAWRRWLVVGRHCESGDVLATDVPLPADVRPVIFSRCPAPARTTIRWRPTTTWSDDRR